MKSFLQRVWFHNLQFCKESLCELVLCWTWIQFTFTKLIYFYASKLSTKNWLLDLIWNEFQSIRNWNFLHKKRKKNIGTTIVNLQSMVKMRKKGLTEFFAGTCHSWRQCPCNQQGWRTTTEWGTQQHLGTAKSCLRKFCLLYFWWVYHLPVGNVWLLLIYHLSDNTRLCPRKTGICSGLSSQSESRIMSESQIRNLGEWEVY